jgi:hypothetical protein
MNCLFTFAVTLGVCLLVGIAIDVFVSKIFVGPEGKG